MELLCARKNDEKQEVSPGEASDERPELLGPSEINRRIRDGRERRSQMKQVIKRLLGNARAVAAGVLISTVAMLGAAMEAQVRPDVLELFDGHAQMPSSLSRLGWCTAKPVNVSSDMCDRDARDELI